MKPIAGPLLKTIDSPEDLRKLKDEDLVVLCDELRQFIIDAVSRNPGHLGANLGTVELSVALHYVFNTPYDRVVWDVGHQAYAHKILTGRRDQFHTNRVFKGISGFPRRDESPYDSFGTGHTSTSISAALGMAMASAYKGEKDRQHIAIIGDGSLTGGMAFEALNHAGVSNCNLLIIINDNKIAIDNNVGALKEYLTDITSSGAYNKLKDDLYDALGFSNKVGRYLRFAAKKMGRVLKGALIKESNLFESLNLRYFGPVDGHDVVRLAKTMEDLKTIPGVKILHCITTKGKGFSEAEKDQTLWHAPGLFDSSTGERLKTSCTKAMPPKYQDVFGHTIIELAEKNDAIMGITPAMASGCSLNLMMEAMPHRAFDVGIAEQHAVTFSAGLASQGLIPFCNIYSSFLQRAYDQIIHDIAIQKLQVVLCIDRAGLVGEDGATHHGSFDISYLRNIPNMIVSAPLNEKELRNLMYTAQCENNGPFSIRYPRGAGVMAEWKTPFEKLEIGKGQLLRDGKDIAILSFGHIGNHVIKNYQKFDEAGISVEHYDMRFVKPIDEEILHQVFKNFKKIITLEDGMIKGGFGSAVLEFKSQNHYQSDVTLMGIPDEFIEHGTPLELYRLCGIDSNGILNVVMRELGK